MLLLLLYASKPLGLHEVVCYGSSCCCQCCFSETVGPLQPAQYVNISVPIITVNVSSSSYSERSECALGLH